MTRLNVFYTTILFVAIVSCGRDKGVTNNEGVRMQYRINENKVKVDLLSRKPFQTQLVSNGKLSASQQAILSFSSSGKIADIKVKNGQSVRVGEVLAELEKSTLRLSYEAAEIAYKKATLDYYDVLAGMGYSISDTTSIPSDILMIAKIRSGYLSAKNTLDKAENELDGTKIIAPFNGRIANVTHNRCDEIKSGESICTLISDKNMNVLFSVIESDYWMIEKGLRVMISPFGTPEKLSYGEISEINPVVDKNGQVLVKATVSNNKQLLDGMNVKVIVEKPIGELFVVPRSAVVVRDNMSVLFRYDNGKAEWVYVNVLNSNAESHAVEANSERGAHLNEGDTIIVSGNLNLADGSIVVIE